jgi:hypothetical protein
MIQQQQTYFLELYRAGLRAASDIFNASLENAQRLQDQQMQAVREVIETNRKSTENLSNAHSISEMMSVQLKQAEKQAGQFADLWTRTWRTATETQVAVLGHVQNQVGQLSERVTDTMRETYSLGTRTAEQAMNTAGDAAREAAREADRKHAQRKSA